MMAFLQSIQDSGYATWLRETESIWGEDFSLVTHALGMSFLVGLNMAIDLRILGAARRLPLAPMEKFYPLMWTAFYINLVSGILLLIAYPIKAFIDPGFYIKMAAVALGMVVLVRIRRRVFGNPAYVDTRPVPMDGKILAATSMFLWAISVTAGRVMAYSDVTGAQRGTTIAVIITYVLILVLLAIGSSLMGALGWSWDKPARQDA